MTAPQIDAPRKRDDANWASPVDRLSATDVPGARDDAVTGKRVTGPLQGFGQLWQKTFRVPLDGVDLTPQAVVAIWKDEFSTFWPAGQRFYAPLSGIAPGEVALLVNTPEGAESFRDSFPIRRAALETRLAELERRTGGNSAQ